MPDTPAKRRLQGRHRRRFAGIPSAQQPCPSKKSGIGAWRNPATSDRQRPQGNRGHPTMSDVQADRLERMNRFVKRMNEVERDLTAPYVRPKDAATLILVDRSGPLPKVLLGKRHERHKFMPGKFVFPGGRVEPSARQMATLAALQDRHVARLMTKFRHASAANASVFALAAFRVTYNETGLMLGAPTAG